MALFENKLTLQGAELSAEERQKALKGTFEKLIPALSASNMTLSSCESFTAGLFSAWCASIPGASLVLQGALVTYQNEIKERVAGVPDDIINRFGAVSAQCAASMAENVRIRIPSCFGVSFTGNAGPGAMEDKPAGLLYLGFATEQRTETYQIQADPTLGRNVIRELAVLTMAKLLCELLEIDE